MKKYYLMIPILLLMASTVIAQRNQTVTRTATINGAGTTTVVIPFDTKAPFAVGEVYLYGDTTATGIFNSTSGLDIKIRPMMKIGSAYVASANDSLNVLANWSDSLSVRTLYNWEASTAEQDCEAWQVEVITVVGDTMALTIKVPYARKKTGLF